MYFHIKNAGGKAIKQNKMAKKDFFFAREIFSICFIFSFKGSQEFRKAIINKIHKLPLQQRKRKDLKK